MRTSGYLLLYFALICSKNHVEGQQSGDCQSYVNRIKRNNFEEITKLKKKNSKKDNKIRTLKIENELLKDKISMYNSMSDNNEHQSETAPSIRPETPSTINLENLPDRIKCDTNGQETESQCIKKLQTIFQKFIDVTHELKIQRHETPHNYEKRLEILVADGREKETFYSRLYQRCQSNLIMTSRERKLAEDLVKCKENLIVAEHKHDKVENKACASVASSPTHSPGHHSAAHLSVMPIGRGLPVVMPMALPKPTAISSHVNDRKQALTCEGIIDDMLETVVYDDQAFEVKKEDGGITIKKLKTEWRTVSFPKSQNIMSFKVINKSGSISLFPYFSNTPYTNKTGYPLYHHTCTIGSRSDEADYFRTRGSEEEIKGTGIPKWNNKNDSFTLTKKPKSKFIDLSYSTSSGSSKFTVDPNDYGTYDVENMTPVIEMRNKGTDILITNIRDANNQFC